MKQKVIKIGYQGAENSNNYNAAHLMAEHMSDTKIEFLPLISSENVMKALQKREITYGVMAISTDVAGEVEETKRACAGIELDTVDSININIHHCLFKKNENVNISDITEVASHIEALKECEKSIHQLLPKAKMISVEDTAMAAYKLKKGILSKNVAVLCSEQAGRKNELNMIKENIEDLEYNGTKFVMVKLKSN